MYFCFSLQDGASADSAVSLPAGPGGSEKQRRQSARLHERSNHQPGGLAGRRETQQPATQVREIRNSEWLHEPALIT